MHSSEHTKFSGNIPQNYDQYLGPFLFEPYALDIVARVNPKQVTNVLEVACGTGRVTNHLRKALPPNVRIIASDLNPDMLAIAKQRITDESIEYLQADAQALPFDDNSFDLVVCQFGYMFVPDKQKAFAEAYRVLKQNGCILFNTWDKIEKNPVINTVKEIVSDFFRDNPPAFYSTPFSMYEPDEIKQLLKNAGFTDVKTEYVTKEGVSSSALDIAKGFIIGNPVYQEIINVDPSAPEKVIEKAEKEVSKLYGDKPPKSELNAWVCEGRK